MAVNTAVFNGPVGLFPPREMVASQGAFFNVTNPTAGTAIAYALQTAFSATANGLFAVQNTNNANGGKSLYFDYLNLVQTATAPTGTLAMRFEVFKETGLVTLTGNVATRTPVQVAGAYPQTTGAVVQSFAAGAATVPAAVGTRRLIDVGSIQTGVAVQHDNYFIDFGGDPSNLSTAGLTAARATAPARIGTVMAPVVVAPQETAWINMWWVTAATNIPSFEFSLTYWEV